MLIVILHPHTPHLQSWNAFWPAMFLTDPLTATRLLLPYSVVFRGWLLFPGTFLIFFSFQRFLRVLLSFDRFLQSPSYHFICWILLFLLLFLIISETKSSELQISAFKAKCTVNLRKTSQNYKNSPDYGSCTMYVWLYLKVRNRQI